MREWHSEQGIWYAVVEEEEGDLGRGSSSIDEAIEILMSKEGYASIVVVELGPDPTAIDEIRKADIERYEGRWVY